MKYELEEKSEETFKKLDTENQYLFFIIINLVCHHDKSYGFRIDDFEYDFIEELYELQKEKEKK